MSNLIHIPALRFGKPYKSFDVVTTKGAEISQVNAGLIRRDLLNIEQATAELAEIPMQRLLAISKKAGELFLNGIVPVGIDERIILHKPHYRADFRM
jgi:hypothetical protein